MQPWRARVKLFVFPLAVFVIALLAARSGWCDSGAGGDEVRRLEASLSNMEDFLRLRQQEAAGQDPETIRLQNKAGEARKNKDATYDLLTRSRDIRRRAKNDPTATPSELAQVDSLVRQVEDDWSRAEKDWEIAESNLAAHRHRILYVRSRETPIPMVEQQCESLRRQLAVARQNSRVAPVPAPPPPTSSWSGENIILSGQHAMNWLRRNGYLGTGDVPTARFRDWQSRLHSSLDRSNHPLQGVSGEYYFTREGGLEGPIHIVVKPGMGDDRMEPGPGPGGQPGRVVPVPTDAPVDESSRNALLAKLRDYHARWYAAWCRKVLSGCAIIPNGVRDELRQWIKNAKKQRQIDRCERLLSCYDSCVMQRPTTEAKVNQCRDLCKKSNK